MNGPNIKKMVGVAVAAGAFMAWGTNAFATADTSVAGAESICLKTQLEPRRRGAAGRLPFHGGRRGVQRVLVDPIDGRCPEGARRYDAADRLRFEASRSEVRTARRLPE